MKRILNPTTTAAVLASVLALASAGAAAGIKCWTNKDGVRECGNSVPPEYSQQSHEELSKQGVILRETERAKTKAELKKEEEKRKQAEEEAKQSEIRAKHDRVLLSTFTTEDDMVITRDGQLAAIDNRVKNTERLLAKLEAKKRDLEEQAAKQERSGKAVSAELKDSIAAVDERIGEHHDYITKRHEEKKEIMARFQADLERYRELKAGKPIGSP